MRVVAGSARGRRLVAPAGESTRPTPDRVREATFNALASLGAIVGARVVDLFAGSGALGIEALSRGAEHATFVDSDRVALEAVRANVAACDVEDRSDIVHDDALRFLGRASGRWDLALLDPPYAFDDWDELLRRISAELAVVESDRPVEPPAGWAVARQKRYGSTTVSILSVDPPT